MKKINFVKYLQIDLRLLCDRKYCFHCRNQSI